MATIVDNWNFFELGEVRNNERTVAVKYGENFQVEIVEDFMCPPEERFTVSLYDGLSGMGHLLIAFSMHPRLSDALHKGDDMLEKEEPGSTE